MSYYDFHSQRLFDQYNAISAEQVHACWLHLLNSNAGNVCDIGAGAGRDADWLQSLGWTVLAVKPSSRLRELAQSSCSGEIEWVDDSLPELLYTMRRNELFDLVLISAVWMHLNRQQREAAMVSVRKLLKPSGLLVISLRFGPDDGREFYRVNFAELNASASSHGLMCVFEQWQEDAYGRKDVSWHTACFKPCG